MTINHNVTRYPHKDTGNVGRETLAMLLGDFEGGWLFTETGEVYRDKGVWRRYDGARLTHWNTEHVGDKYSVIVHNNKTSLTWAKWPLPETPVPFPGGIFRAESESIVDAERYERGVFGLATGARPKLANMAFHSQSS